MQPILNRSPEADTQIEMGRLSRAVKHHKSRSGLHTTTRTAYLSCLAALVLEATSIRTIERQVSCRTSFSSGRMKPKVVKIALPGQLLQTNTCSEDLCVEETTTSKK
eukprot:1297022-Amphidinium_carterae.1